MNIITLDVQVWISGVYHTGNTCTHNAWNIYIYIVHNRVLYNVPGLCIAKVGIMARLLCRAARSNLQMIRPSLMLTVKLQIIRARKARGKILDLASYLAVRRHSQSTTLQLQTGGYHYFVFLPCKKNLKFDNILRKHLRFSAIRRTATKAKTYTMHVG